MDETQIKLGDKVFLYGMFLQFLPEDEFDYNTVKGFSVNEMSGFVVDFVSIDSLAWRTAFSDFVDVTESLTRKVPSPAGTKIWMPMPSLLGRSQTGYTQTHHDQQTNI